MKRRAPDMKPCDECPVVEAPKPAPKAEVKAEVKVKAEPKSEKKSEPKPGGLFRSLDKKHSKKKNS